MIKIILILITTVFMFGATAQVDTNETQYTVTVKSDNKRIPDAITVIDIPAAVPIVKDSYFNGCIIFDGNGSFPVPNTKVVVIGDDWNVTTSTLDSGCFDTLIPSDSKFTFKAIDPRTKKYSSLDGDMLSAPKGQLLNSDNLVVTRYEYTLEKEIGVKTFVEDKDGFTYTVDTSVKKHSVAVRVPTIKSKEYVVSFISTKPVWVYFGGNSRRPNPAKVSSINKVVTLKKFKATDTFTNLYFQPRSNAKITISSLKIRKL